MVGNQSHPSLANVRGYCKTCYAKNQARVKARRAALLAESYDGGGRGRKRVVHDP
jgi:hypothetical protein